MAVLSMPSRCCRLGRDKQGSIDLIQLVTKMFPSKTLSMIWRCLRDLEGELDVYHSFLEVI